MWAWVEFHLQSSPTGKEHDPKALRNLGSQRATFAVENLACHIANIRNLVAFNDSLNILAERVIGE